MKTLSKSPTRAAASSSTARSQRWHSSFWNRISIAIHPRQAPMLALATGTGYWNRLQELATAPARAPRRRIRAPTHAIRASPSHGRLHLRPVQDRHRTELLAHGGADARRGALRAALAGGNRCAGAGGAGDGGAVRFAGPDRPRPRHRQGGAAGAGGPLAGPG